MWMVQATVPGPSDAIRPRQNSLESQRLAEQILRVRTNAPGHTFNVGYTDRALDVFDLGKALFYIDFITLILYVYTVF
jgi:hypothetical protein